MHKANFFSPTPAPAQVIPFPNARIVRDVAQRKRFSAIWKDAIRMAPNHPREYQWRAAVVSELVERHMKSGVRFDDLSHCDKQRAQQAFRELTELAGELNGGAA